MSDLDPPEQDVAADEKKRRKQAEKARGAWISFAGRIIAQIVGAVASVVLGVMVLQRYNTPPAGPASSTTPAASAAVARAAVPRKPGNASIAVLPLDNLSGNAEQEYFVDGMTEALISSLANVDGLRVISRTSTARYKTEQRSIPEIAQALGVDLVVEGSVLQSRNQVRITTQLIDAATDEHLWAESYTRTLDDVIQLQDAVATAIATAIKGTVSRRPGSGPATLAAIDPVAYDLYLRGRHAWFMRTPESLKAAVGFFTSAIDRAPTFALAHVGLADAIALSNSPSAGLGDQRERTARAKASAVRALELDPNLAEAHTALGGVLYFGERNTAEAERAFRRAIELNPSYPVAHEWLGILLGESGRDTEAMEHSEQAVRLDPLEATMYQARGMLHYNARRFADAVASQERALELQPSLPLAKTLLVKAHTLAGNPRRALEGCPSTSIDDGALVIACAGAAARAGDRERLAGIRRSVDDRRPPPELLLAQIDAATGDFPSAFARLNALAARGNLAPGLGFDPFFDELRRQPQWPALAARLPARSAGSPSQAPPARR